MFDEGDSVTCTLVSIVEGLDDVEDGQTVVVLIAVVVVVLVIAATVTVDVLVTVSIRK